VFEGHFSVSADLTGQSINNCKRAEKDRGID
jgi:hypothetical protein